MEFKLTFTSQKWENKREATMANHGKKNSAAQQVAQGQQAQQPQAQAQGTQQQGNAATQQTGQSAASSQQAQAGTQQMSQILSMLQQMQQGQNGNAPVTPTTTWWTRTRITIATIVAFVVFSLSAVSLGLWAENIRVVSYQSGYTAGQKIGYESGKEYMALKYAATPWWRRWISGLTGNFPE